MGNNLLPLPPPPALPLSSCLLRAQLVRLTVKFEATLSPFPAVAFSLACEPPCSMWRRSCAGRKGHCCVRHGPCLEAGARRPGVSRRTRLGCRPAVQAFGQAPAQHQEDSDLPRQRLARPARGVLPGGRHAVRGGGAARLSLLAYSVCTVCVQCVYSVYTVCVPCTTLGRGSVYLLPPEHLVHVQACTEAQESFPFQFCFWKQCWLCLFSLPSALPISPLSLSLLLAPPRHSCLLATE